MKVLYAVLGILVIVLAFEAGYFVYQNKMSITKTSAPVSTSKSVTIKSLPVPYQPGLKTLSETYAKQKEFINEVQFQIVFRGTLKSDDDTQIVLQNKEKQTIIPKDPLIRDKITYFRASPKQGDPAVKIAKSDIKAGDTIDVNTIINPLSGKVLVIFITKTTL